LIRLLFM